MTRHKKSGGSTKINFRTHVLERPNSRFFVFSLDQNSLENAMFKETNRTCFVIFCLENATKFWRQKACLENVSDYVQTFISKKCLCKLGDRLHI